jgi:hypothetical protein
MFIATLVAPDGLEKGDISIAADLVHGIAGPIIDGVACDIHFSGDSFSSGQGSPRKALEAQLTNIDVIVQVDADRRRSLLRMHRRASRLCRAESGGCQSDRARDAW